MIKMQEKATVFETWKVKKTIGTGTYGKVYEIENSDGEKSVYKIMKIPVEPDNSPGTFPRKTQEDCLKEVKRDILSTVKYLQVNDRGRYFVSYEDFAFSASPDSRTLTFEIRMEWLMSLSDIAGQTALAEDEILRLAINICTCLEKCRKLGIVYPNLKPDNIFIAPDRCKLGDLGNFGFYEPVNMNVSMRKTQEYSAPELINSGKLNETSDTYSLGLIIYSLLNNNRLPFIPRYTKTVGINDITDAINKRSSNYIFPDPDNGSEAIKKIISKACSFSVDARYSSPTDMKRDLIYVLKKQEEEFENNSSEMGETVPEVTNDEEKIVPSVEGIKTYAYDDSHKKHLSVDKKKKILLIAIAVVFLILVALIVATFLRDIQPVAILNPLEVKLQNYGWGQAFSEYIIR